ncbi:heme-binding domain-containing protein [bacterium]|nr:heme-binding domain-containing protein [bacterium]
MSTTKKVLVGILLIIIVAVVAIQFVPVERSNPPVEAALVADAQVVEVIKTSCFDCHSNETVWPWYSYVAPVSWQISEHVTEGREHLNFSNWENLDPDRRGYIAEEILDEIEEGGMPLPVYLRMHPQAAVDDQELEVIRRWAEAIMEGHESDAEGDGDGDASD